ncbi:MAG TPA: hypothetical protein VF017_22435 [Thermoanaerobaculia bacterium]|nr:hypothetical protein [Thermoanaerobaculia bacterium]
MAWEKFPLGWTGGILGTPANFLQVFRDIAAIAAALVGVCVALRGLQTWRRQLRANTELEVARLMVRAVLKLRDAIQDLRNPFVAFEEMVVAAQTASEQQPDRTEEFLKKWHRPVFTQRSKPVALAHSEYRAAKLEAEILWGQPFQQECEEFDVLLHDLHIALEDFVRYSDRDHPTLEEEAEREASREVVQRSGKVDSFGVKLTAACDRIEAYLRPKIRLGLN